MVERMVVEPVHTNVYVFATAKKECIVIDPGADGPAIVRRLEAMNMKPRAILLTHGHLDHTSAARYVQEHYEEEVPLAIHKSDAKMLGGKAAEFHRELYSGMGPQGEALFEELYSPLPDPDIKLKDGDTILDTDLTVIHTPGHTPGSVCFYSEEERAVFTGDTLFFKAIGTTDLEKGNHKQLIKSITERLLTLPPETRLYPAHGPLSAIEREVKNNPALRREGVI
jgi:glyoxylase-like metal-dependent hydrolase (beta-lactamase superfamily II)